MDLKTQVTIKEIKNIETFSSGFTKKCFIATSLGEYPQDIQFELYKDSCSIIDKFTVGQVVDVSFNIRSNEHNGRYYTNLNCWRIESAADGEPFKAGPSGVKVDGYGTVDDNLPF